METVVDMFHENQESLNENTLLQELTKKCPQKLERKILSNEGGSGNENESNCVNQGKLTARSSQTAKSKAEISKASMNMEPTNNGLRDIIIDGSNVAMWWVWPKTYFLFTTVRVVLVYKHNFEL